MIISEISYIDRLKSLNLFDYNKVIKRDVLFSILELEEPKSVSEYKSFAFEVMNKVEMLRDELSSYSMILRAERNNWRIINPSEHIEEAIKHRNKAKRSLEKSQTICRITDKRKLSEDELSSMVRLEGILGLQMLDLEKYTPEINEIEKKRFKLRVDTDSFGDKKELIDG